MDHLKLNALVGYTSDSETDSDSAPAAAIPSPATKLTAASKKRPASPSTSTDDDSTQPPPLKKVNIIRVQAPDLSLSTNASNTGSSLFGSAAKPLSSSAGGSGLFAFLPKPSNAAKPAAAPAVAAIPKPVATEPTKPDAVESSPRASASSSAPAASASWRKLAPPSAFSAAAKSKSAVAKSSSANEPAPTPAATAAAVPTASATGKAPPSSLANQPSVPFFSFDDDEADTETAPLLGPSLPPPTTSSAAAHSPTAAVQHTPYFTPPTHASPYTYHPAPLPSSTSSSSAAPTDLDTLAHSLGVDRRDLAKLGISSKHALAPSSVHTVSVRDALASEDLETLAAASKAAAPKPIHEHISSSTKLNIVQLAKKAVTQNSDLQASFAAQRAKKKSGNTKYGF